MGIQGRSTKGTISSFDKIKEVKDFAKINKIC